jgi:hypothetical protein
MQHPETKSINVTTVQALLKINNDSAIGVAFILGRSRMTIARIVKNNTPHVVIFNPKGGFTLLN